MFDMLMSWVDPAGDKGASPSIAIGSSGTGVESALLHSNAGADAVTAGGGASNQHGTDTATESAGPPRSSPCTPENE